MSHLQPYRYVQVALAGTFVLALAAFLGGCAHRPQVLVVDERLGEASAEAQRVEFVLELTNPADVPIELREVSYRLRVDGRDVYSGRRAAQATLPAGGSVQVVMPAVLSLTEHPRENSPERYLLSGSLSYIRPGAIARMLRDVGMPRPRVGFAHEGQATWGEGR